MHHETLCSRRFSIRIGFPPIPLRISRLGENHSYDSCSPCLEKERKKTRLVPKAIGHRVSFVGREDVGGGLRLNSLLLCCTLSSCSLHFCFLFFFVFGIYADGMVLNVVVTLERSFHTRKRTNIRKLNIKKKHTLRCTVQCMQNPKKVENRRFAV